MVLEHKPAYCLQGAGATSQNSKGMGYSLNRAYTLNTTDVHGVAFTCNTIDRHAVAYQDKTGSLCARDYKGVGSQYVSEDKLVIAPTNRYIVRRLTPTECARLQGFADTWGHIEQKDNLTDEEYRFLVEVRNTHAAINGKAVKEYTKKQMLTWYNKLWTDAAEYKMWGNGIALPPALYIMQGFVDALEKKEMQGCDEDDD